MKIPGNATPKARANPYSGRTSHGGADGLGEYRIEGIKAGEEWMPQDKESRRIDYASGDVKPGWLRGGARGAPGVTDERPNFDKSPARKGNSQPMSVDGGNMEKSPFSPASKATSAESDWNPNYKPNKARG